MADHSTPPGHSGVDSPTAQDDSASASDDLLEQLRAEHAHLEAKLEEYADRVHLSAREQLERKRLQKLKLRTKDRMVHYELAANEEPNARSNDTAGGG